MSWRVEPVGVRECAMSFRELPTKERPRYDRRSGRAYTPQRTLRAESEIRRQWMRACGDSMGGFGGEVRVRIEAQRPLARSNPRFWAGRADLMKPDADNLAKVVCDSLNGLAYKDDSQITQLSVTFDRRVPHCDACLVRVRVEYYEERYEKERI